MRNSYMALTAFFFVLLNTPVPAQQADGCKYDSQCKLDRICDKGMCVDPSSRNLNLGNGQPQNQTVDADRNFAGMNLGWCDKDWGVNEGAQEAINYINAAASMGYGSQIGAVIGTVNNLPAGVGDAIAKNTLKRPPVMDTAKALVHVDANLAVQLALTCQAHNGAVRQQLSNRPDLVAAYLKGEIPNLWPY